MKAKKSEEPKDTWLDFKVRLLSASEFNIGLAAVQKSATLSSPLNRAILNLWESRQISLHCL
jgi:hypothetical protein